MKFEIKHRKIETVLFGCDLPVKVAKLEYRLQLGFAVKQAAEAHASLAHASLAGADLAYADLAYADLAYAILAGANLSGANLTHANLACADLTHANLAGANLADVNLAYTDLRQANLTYADLREADFVCASLAFANLAGANLTHADLTHADLTGANLDSFRQDVIVESLKWPNELEALRSVIIDGQLEGSSGQNIGPFWENPDSPRACWFTMIKPGDTPATNPASKLALSWLDEAIAIRDNILAWRRKYHEG